MGGAAAGGAARGGNHTRTLRNLGTVNSQLANVFATNPNPARCLRVITRFFPQTAPIILGVPPLSSPHRGTLALQSLLSSFPANKRRWPTLLFNLVQFSSVWNRAGDCEIRLLFCDCVCVTWRSIPGRPPASAFTETRLLSLISYALTIRCTLLGDGLLVKTPLPTPFLPSNLTHYSSYFPMSFSLSSFHAPGGFILLSPLSPFRSVLSACCSDGSVCEFLSA